MRYGLVLLIGLAAVGCGAQKTDEAPGSPREVASSTRAAEAPEESEPAAAPSTAPATDPFGDRQKVRELRDLWDSKSYAYMIPSAETLLGRTSLDATLRMEVCHLLARAYAGLGETAKAEEAEKKFRQLREEYQKGEEGPRQLQLRASARGFAGELRKKRLEALPPDERVRQSDVIAGKLDGAADDAVFEVDSENGGRIHFSKDGKALEQKLAGVKVQGEEPVICLDPEFGYYYAIEEEPPPPAAGDVR